jgi:hypothetical protein
MVESSQERSNDRSRHHHQRRTGLRAAAALWSCRSLTMTVSFLRQRAWTNPWPSSRCRSLNRRCPHRHGIVMPQCHRGGPGRAGNRAELGGLHGLRFYHQRVAVRRSRPQHRIDNADARRCLPGSFSGSPSPRSGAPGFNRQRRNDAELQSAGKNTAAVTGGIDEIAGCAEYPLRSPRDLNTDFGQRHVALSTFRPDRPQAIFRGPGSASTAPAE